MEEGALIFWVEEALCSLWFCVGKRVREGCVKNTVVERERKKGNKKGLELQFISLFMPFFKIKQNISL